MRSGAKLIHKSSNNSGTLYQIENYVGLRIESNGPQLYRCGNQALHGQTEHCHHRFNGGATLSLRKYDSLEPAAQVPIRLQWGRNFIVAEMVNATAYIHLFRYALQWGRNFIVAEMFENRCASSTYT